MENIYNVLSKIQKEITAPKNQKNNFGNYTYRSVEDIMQAVKPLLPIGIVLTLSEDLVLFQDRFYIKATASISDGSSKIETSSFARETLEKKGMDLSQITGSTTSYARKYALQGLLLLDDNKDADSQAPEKKDGKLLLISKEILQYLSDKKEVPTYKQDIFVQFFKESYNRDVLYDDISLDNIQKLVKKLED